MALPALPVALFLIGEAVYNTLASTPLNVGEDEELEKRRKYFKKDRGWGNTTKKTADGEIEVRELPPPKYKKGGKVNRKVSKVMKEYKKGTLRSGSKKKVKNRKQAIAIALNSKRKKK